MSAAVSQDPVCSPLASNPSWKGRGQFWPAVFMPDSEPSKVVPNTSFPFTTHGGVGLWPSAMLASQVPAAAPRATSLDFFPELQAY